MNLLACCLYVQLGVANMFLHPVAPHGSWWHYDINDIVNPYGLAEVGWEYPLPKNFTITLALRHDSSMPEGDFGQNTAELRFKWYPWRGR